MTALRTIWSGEKQPQRTVMIVSGIIVAAGIALIILGVAAGWGQSRLPGAVLITFGGAASGAAVGFSRPARNQIWSRLMSWRVWIALLSAIVIATPATLAMASATFGPLAGGGHANNTALVVVGSLIGLVFMVGTFLAALVAVEATRRRVAPAPQRDSNTEQGKERA